MNYGPEVNSIEELKALIEPKLLAGFKLHQKPSKKKIKPIKERKLPTVKKVSQKVVKKLATVLPTVKEMSYFVVIGKPSGYYSLGMKPNYSRMNKYHTYKKLVCKYAELSGIKLPLVCSKENHLHINTVAYFESGVHPDPENVRKGIIDSLFYSKDKKGCGDKYVGGFCESPMYDKENPRVEVTIIKNSNCKT